MKLQPAGLVLTVCLVSMLSAQEPSPYEAALKQVVASFEQISVSLKTIMDKDTAEAARPELRKSAKAFLEARDKAEKLPQPEQDEKARLEKMYKPRLEENLKKVDAQMRRIRLEMIPGGEEALAEIAGIFKKNGKQ